MSEIERGRGPGAGGRGCVAPERPAAARGAAGAGDYSPAPDPRPPAPARERPELERQIERFLEDLARRNDSPHTVTAYAGDLRQFLEYFSPPGAAPPEPREFDALQIREWLADLYARNLAAVSIRRKLAALRMFFRFLLREGAVPLNPAKLVRTPKAPKMLPAVMTAEQANKLIDAVAERKVERPYPARDRAIFELLYGCGLRVSELVGMNLDDLDMAERWLRVRGKGRKERQVPYGSRAADALERYLAERPVRVGEPARVPEPPRRAPDRAWRPRHREVLRQGAGARLRRASAQFPPRLRHASAVLTAPTCAPSRNCWATRASPPPRNTRRSRSRT